MKETKREKLRAAGWAMGSVQEFLRLSDADAALIEIKLCLSRSLRERRQQRRVSQVELARRLRSSQSRVAKMEAGDPSVSMDLLVSSLLVLGASATDLAKAIRSDHLPRRSPGSARGKLKIRRDFDAPVPRAVLHSLK
jgi:transcriptional regulator with XRE-family HTH domain